MKIAWSAQCGRAGLEMEKRRAAGVPDEGATRVIALPERGNAGP